MARLNISLAFTLITVSNRGATSIAFLTSMVRINPIVASQSNKQRLTTISPILQRRADVSVKSSPSKSNVESPQQSLVVEAGVFGNNDAVVESFRRDMIDLVYSRSLERMDDLSLN